MKRGLSDTIALANGTGYKKIRWETFEEWYRFGIKESYEKRNREILRRSRKKEERSWYSRGNTMRSEKWLEKFQFEKKRKTRPYGFLKKMGNRKLLDYTFSLHGESVTRTELYRKDQMLYNELSNRGLIEKIKMAMRPRGYIRKMSNSELLDYCSSLYGDKITKGELEKKDGTLYQNIVRRGLSDKLESDKKPDGYWKKWENFERELLKFIEENNGEFPATRRLVESERSDLRNASRHYGGLYAVREKIGYNEIKRIELAKELEKILAEI